MVQIGTMARQETTAKAVKSVQKAAFSSKLAIDWTLWQGRFVGGNDTNDIAEKAMVRPEHIGFIPPAGQNHR
jgi:hypothetical protein